MKKESIDIIERLQDAANIMHEHAQYNDEESEHNGEGLAAETCEDAADLITELLSVLEAILPHASRRIQGTTDGDPILNSARAAIAKAKGENK
jgi:hypothetical protein